MGKIRIELNDAGIKELLRSAEVEAELLDRGFAIAEAAGEGHEEASWQGHDRVHVSVSTTTPEAARSEAEDRTLTRAIDAGRF